MILLEHLHDLGHYPQNQQCQYRTDHRRRLVDDRGHRRFSRVGARGDGGAQYLAGIDDPGGDAEDREGLREG